MITKKEIGKIIRNYRKQKGLTQDELAEKVSEKFTPKQLVTDCRIICADSASEEMKEKVQIKTNLEAINGYILIL